MNISGSQSLGRGMRKVETSHLLPSSLPPLINLVAISGGQLLMGRWSFSGLEPGVAPQSRVTNHDRAIFYEPPSNFVFGLKLVFKKNLLKKKKPKLLERLMDMSRLFLFNRNELYFVIDLAGRHWVN